MKYRDKIAEQTWEAYRKNLQRSTPLPQETAAEQKKRIKLLEKKGNEEAWFKYYFPNYYSSEPAPFHPRATKRLFYNPRWYEVRSWSRELAKSTRGMMEDIYMAMTGMASVFLLISHTNTNAAELLMPYMINLESNDRLINDYGLQKGRRNWETGKFVTRNGCSFRGIGAGESPRGTKNEEKRPEVIRFDDLDTDERCKSEKRMKKLWEWVEQAVIPTVSISGNVRIIFQGNKIAKDCVIERAKKYADKVDIINIRDKKGKSTWPQKNTEEQIDWLLSKMTSRSSQKEYFNNPITGGSVFVDMRFGKVPQLRSFPFLLIYGDPSPSNKSGKGSSGKAVWLLGKLDNVLYVIKGYVASTTNYKFIEWFHFLKEYVDDKNTLYYYLENNSLQDPFFEQVYTPLMEQINQQRDDSLYIMPDERSKPEKFTRIEGGLLPLHEFEKLVFNVKYKDDKHMADLIEQFEDTEEDLSSAVDGPDCIEGGNWVIDNKLRVLGGITNHSRKRSKKRY